jgi:hypothetical protein
MHICTQGAEEAEKERQNTRTELLHGRLLVGVVVDERLERLLQRVPCVVALVELRVWGT